MNTSDADLIQRILDGDQDAFTTIVNKYQKSVHALVWRKIGDFHIAEEITQDVFLKVYKRLSTLKRRDHFPGWLYVIATRRCIAWLRKKQLPTKSLDAMSTVQLEELCYTQYEVNRCEETAIEHRSELVKRLLQKLPESERTVVTLYYLAEMTGEEISMFLGVSPNTVRSRLLRARQRLKKEESMIQEVLSNFQLAPNLTENIVREIARLKPTSPSASKPWIPWGLSFASTFLVILIMGFGTRALSRFQQPYSLDATSEMTIELVDAPIVLELARKSDALTRFGRTDIPGKNSASGFQADPLLLAAAQADETNLPTAEPEWIQMTKGPGGVSRAGLFLASDQTLYAIAKTGLYRLTEETDTWGLVSATGPNQEFDPVMAEYGDTLYLLTLDELLVSVDTGKTWNSLGARPQGRAVALIITDTAMYLVLQTEVFRSEDIGNQWQPIGKGLKTDNLPAGNFRIWDALAIDNTLYVGTNQGLFRLTDDWEKLPVPTSHGIKSLAVAEDRLYVGTICSPKRGPGWSPYASVFYSTDRGDLWIDITPDTDQYPFKLAVAVGVVTVGDTLMLVGSSGVLLSYNGGETWMDPMPGPHTFRSFFGALPTVALDENNFYKIANRGIVRSTDGGATWQLFVAGLVNSHVPSLVTIENVLYALTPTQMLKSADGGESWEAIGLNGKENTSFEGAKTKVATANGVLYASTSALKGVTFFRLSNMQDMFLPVEGVPDFEQDTVYKEWEKKFIEVGKNKGDVNKIIEQQPAVFDRAIKEQKTNGTFTVANDTVFMEYRHKLFRWRRGETAWHDTGLEDIKGISPIHGKGFTLAVSENTVYAGKREGELFLSLDNGDTWRDVTEKLAFQYGYFKEILFAGSTVYVSTDMGVMHSRDGETWHALTDADGNRRIMDRIAVDGMTTYGVCDSGVYQVDSQTNKWKQVTPELPHTPTAFAIDGDTFYIGTKQNGVLQFQRAGR
ncbi:MAG: sigma-70 family RNA polymerase sigma factor [Candidatus Poribacteria bacterium]|nr:sigma-70 family RNA polymerase sigma factor [Candidatus Poribacteria bacterium]